jgi:hypothetical protein
MRIEPRTNPAERPLWLPPLASLATLFVLFLTASAARRSAIADASRPVMITLSTVAAVAITLYGVKMVVAARARGLASAVAGLVMVVLGIVTALHVLR